MIRQILYKNTCLCVPFQCEKNACLNYREFDLEGDFVGVPHTWYLSAQSFIRLPKLVWREYDIVAMNEWQKKCVGLHRTWVSKRTVSKQELYFVKDNYEIFSTEVFAREKQGQDSGGPHQGVIGSLGSSSAVRPFWICSPVGEYLSLNVPCRRLCIVQFLFLPSSCEVSLRKQFKKTPGKCRTSWGCD